MAVCRIKNRVFFNFGQHRIGCSVKHLMDDYPPTQIPSIAPVNTSIQQYNNFLKLWKKEDGQNLFAVHVVCITQHIANFGKHDYTWYSCTPVTVPAIFRGRMIKRLTGEKM